MAVKLKCAPELGITSSRANSQEERKTGSPFGRRLPFRSPSLYKKGSPERDREREKYAH